MKIYIYSVILSLAILNLPCVHTSESGEGYISNLADLAESVPAKPSVRAHKKKLCDDEIQKCIDRGAHIRAKRAAAKALLRQKLKGTLYEQEDQKDEIKSEILENTSFDSTVSEDFKKELGLSTLDILQSKLHDNLDPTGKSQKLFVKKQFREDEQTKQGNRKIKQEKKKKDNQIKEARRNKSVAVGE